MSVRTDSMQVTEARQQWARVLHNVTVKRRALRLLRRDEPIAVIVSIEDWDELNRRVDEAEDSGYALLAAAQGDDERAERRAIAAGRRARG